MQQDGPAVAATRPVFVDASGRRGRWIRRLFWGLGIAVSAYVGVVFLALIGPPSLSHLAVPGLGPVLPGSGAPGLRTATGSHGKPASVLPPRTESSPAPSTSTRVSRTSAPQPASVPGSSSPAASPSVRPSPAPTATAAPTPTGPAASPGPRSSATPPGQASGRPSPRSSHAKGGSPQPSPTP